MVELPQILLVEKEQSVINQIVSLVEKIGFQTPKIAATHAEAEKIAGSERPDIALVDLTLEGKGDGQTTARMLREEYNLPVIFLSSSETENEREGVQAPYGYVLKPVDRRNLKKTIMLALSRHSQMDNYSIYLSDLPIPAILISSETTEVLKTNSAFSALFPGIQDQKFLNKFEISNSNITTEFIQIVENAQKSDKPVTGNMVFRYCERSKSLQCVCPTS